MDDQFQEEDVTEENLKNSGMHMTGDHDEEVDDSGDEMSDDGDDDDKDDEDEEEEGTE